MLREGDEVILARAGAESMEASSGTVVEMRGDAPIVTVDERMLFIRPGVLITVRPDGDDAQVGWAELEEVHLGADSVTLHLGAVRWEECEHAMAQRFPVEVSLSASFLDSKGEMTKHTIGHTVDLSITGFRSRLRTPLPPGMAAHVTLYLAHDQPVEALAKVRRVVKGSESRCGGYDVGFVFVRFLRGYDEFAAQVKAQDAEAACAPPVEGQEGSIAA